MNNLTELFSLKGKKILFIGTNFFDYDNAIQSKLEELGASVSHIWLGNVKLFYRFLRRLGMSNLALKYSNKLRKKQ